MKYRKLGKTDISVSEISLGTWAIGGPYWTQGEPTGWTGEIHEDDVISAINLAIDNGVTHFDTADVYGYGKSERLLSKAIGNRRNEVTIATKLGWATTTGPHVYDPFNIRHQCEQSLRNLNTDIIDLYYFHQCDFGENDCYLDGAIDTFHELQKEGKIKYIGVSAYSYEEFERVVPKIKPEVLQSWADIEHDEFIRPDSPLRILMEENNISFIAMMPFGQGRLLGKYKSANPPEFGLGDNRYGNSGFSAEQLALLEPRIMELKKRFGETTCDLARVALQFLLAQPVVACVIPGFRNKSQVECNLKAADKELTSQDIDFILRVFPRDEMGPHPWAE